MNAQSLSVAPQLYLVPDLSQPAHPLPVSLQPAERSDDFWKIWLQHRDYVHRVCLKCTSSNQIEANELLAQARDKAQAKWAKHAHKVTNPKSWLSCLAKHLYIDLYRSKERKNKVHSGLQKEAMGAIAHQASPESNLLNRELESYLHQIVKELPANLREPFILRFLYDKTYKEIAFQLNLAEANVRKRIQYARQQLREPLQQYLSGLSKATIIDEPNSSNH